ncbi:hypothetical protein G7067_01225 [Leucobacter insecticola]|uniref:Uncharacterized protein n=1 Tax=Leucobacter insecticola TaxID=2714934 RepID=A0A6G8FGF8_9MICO|nr:hypothetical protein [Leucobacter insecticola]QIM15343.1 hypothetical protein G7067_01225 [Leucobacter insecticola]
MRLADLEHIIRASCQHLGQDQIIIIGSQSILGTYNEYELPDESTMSVEADVVPIFDDANESQSTFLDGGIGEFSPFHQLHGYYAQGVGRHTATLPEN